MEVKLQLENFRFVDAEGRDFSDPVFDEQKARWPDFLIAAPGQVANRIQPETRRILLDHFHADNERVFRLLGRRIPAWEI